MAKVLIPPEPVLRVWKETGQEHCVQSLVSPQHRLDPDSLEFVGNMSIREFGNYQTELEKVAKETGLKVEVKLAHASQVINCMTVEVLMLRPQVE